MDPRHLEHVRDDFALLFYRWAQADAEKQATQGFPLLSLLRDSLAAKYLHAYQTLASRDQFIFLRAMVKRTHPRAVELCGELLSIDENKLLEHFFNAPSQNEREQVETGRRRARLTANDRAHLGRLVRAQIAKETNGDFEEWSPGVFVFSRVVGPWCVLTRVGLKNIQNMGYEHSIVLERHPEVRLKENTSITRWLGIGETNWNLMAPDEIEECSRSVIVLANYFLESIPDLLARIAL